MYVKWSWASSWDKASPAISRQLFPNLVGFDRSDHLAEWKEPSICNTKNATIEKKLTSPAGTQQLAQFNPFSPK